MYIIVDGGVRVPDEVRTLVELGPGDFFAELTTLDPVPHSASVTTLLDTQLLGLDRDALYELMASHPEVLRGLIHALCLHLRGKGAAELLSRGPDSTRHAAPSDTVRRCRLRTMRLYPGSLRRGR